MSESSLAVGTVLNDKYRIDAVLGTGDFGITYRAYNIQTNTIVAIKEYFPTKYVMRDITGRTDLVYVASNVKLEDFTAGLKRFAKMAQSLSRVAGLGGTVAVRDFFYGNNTAYTVMDNIDGTSLKNYIETRGLAVAEFMKMFRPLLKTVSKLHSMGIIHRDICPENILVTNDNKLVLTDFGGARLGPDDTEQNRMDVLKHGYAPIEQYYSNGNQGPHTDIYSLCATLYYVLTGVSPVEADLRMDNDTMPGIISGMSIDYALKQALIRGLSVQIESRYASVDELEKDLYSSGAKNDIKLLRVLIAVAIVLVIILAVGIGFFVMKKDKPTPDGTEEATEEESATGENSRDSLMAVFEENCSGNIWKTVYSDFDGDERYEMMVITVNGGDTVTNVIDIPGETETDIDGDAPEEKMPIIMPETDSPDGNEPYEGMPEQERPPKENETIEGTPSEGGAEKLAAGGTETTTVEGEENVANPFFEPENTESDDSEDEQDDDENPGEVEKSNYSIWFVTPESCECVIGNIECANGEKLTDFRKVSFGNERMAVLEKTNENNEEEIAVTDSYIYDVKNGEFIEGQRLQASRLVIFGGEPYLMSLTDDGCVARSSSKECSDVIEMAYPLVYSDGQFKERKSVAIEASDLDEIENWDSVNKEIEEQLLTVHFENANGYEYEGRESVERAEIFYNDNGHIYINYNVGSGNADSSMMAIVDIVLSGKKVEKINYYAGLMTENSDAGIELVESNRDNMFK